ncbi:hypothetical protein DFH09DRAFT_1097026 [Mycena vulgaris]|nr:hypothetical protein DFH09DRAFT_1097026 [Mycena vulgaris]
MEERRAGDDGSRGEEEKAEEKQLFSCCRGRIGASARTHIVPRVQHRAWCREHKNAVRAGTLVRKTRAPFTPSPYKASPHRLYARTHAQCRSPSSLARARSSSGATRGILREATARPSSTRKAGEGGEDARRTDAPNPHAGGLADHLVAEMHAAPEDRVNIGRGGRGRTVQMTCILSLGLRRLSVPCRERAGVPLRSESTPPANVTSSVPASGPEDRFRSAANVHALADPGDGAKTGRDGRGTQGCSKPPHRKKNDRGGAHVRMLQAYPPVHTRASGGERAPALGDDATTVTEREDKGGGTHKLQMAVIVLQRGREDRESTHGLQRRRDRNGVSTGSEKAGWEHARMRQACNVITTLLGQDVVISMESPRRRAPRIRPCTRAGGLARSGVMIATHEGGPERYKQQQSRGEHRCAGERAVRSASMHAPSPHPRRAGFVALRDVEQLRLYASSIVNTARARGKGRGVGVGRYPLVLKGEAWARV